MIEEDDAIAREITDAANQWSSAAPDHLSCDATQAARQLAQRAGISQRNAAKLVGHLGDGDTDKLDAAAELTKRPAR